MRREKPIRFLDLQTQYFFKESILRPPSLTSSQLTTAMSHPTRARVLTVLNDREASPKELSVEIGEPLNNVAYHIDVLTKLGCVELVRTTPTHGGRVVEHFYRAIERSYFDEEAWDRLGDNEKQIVTTTIVRMISHDINEAMAKGTFYDPDDNHLSRIPFVVDWEGWEEIKEILDRTLGELMGIRENVLARSKGGDQETFPARVHMIQFRSPSPKPA